MATSPQNSAVPPSEPSRPDESHAATQHSRADNALTEAASKVPATETTQAVEFAPGQQIRDYELLAKMGEGGMGTVWKARHVELDKTVAIKLLSRKLTNDATLVERFKREMKAVGKLEHAHIVRALDGGEFQGTHFLVLEHFDGQDLSQFVKERGPRSVLEACELLRQAALGLEYAHTHGVVHRDIKPSNLFLAKVSSESRETSDPSAGLPNARTTSSATRFTVKVLDLGLARLQSESPSKAAFAETAITQSGQILGTPDYMAPEQWDDTHAVDHRADLYALGCTLFFLLTGRAPFADGTRNSIMSKLKAHAIDEIPDLVSVAHAARVSQSPLNIPAEVTTLYQRLMAKQPSARPNSAAEVAADLKAIIQRLRSSERSRHAPRDEPNAPTTLDSSPTSNQPATSTARSAHHAERDVYVDATAPLDFFAELQADDRGARGSRATDKTAELRTTTDAREPRAPQAASRRWLVLAAAVASVVLIAIVSKLAAPGRPAVSPNAPSANQPTTTQTTTTEKSDQEPAESKPNARTAEGGQPTDPDRLAAEWVLAQSGEFVNVTIMPLPRGGNRRIQRGEPLPNEPFQITEIGITKASITDAELARYLPRLDKLYHIRLSQCPAITDASVEILRQFSTLNSLEIAQTPITGTSCLELVKALPLLTAITVSANQFSPELSEFIQATPRITVFGLFESDSDAHLKQLLSMSHLTTVTLIHVSAEMESWQELSVRLPKLTWLSVQTGRERTKYTDAHLAAFARCPKLEHLTVSSKSITDSGLTSLSECRTLRELNVRNTSVTAAGIATLQAARPNLKIEWDAP